jgi:hypothetical protein
MIAEERLLAPGRPARADDADNVFVTLGPDGEDQPATDGSDGDEPGFEFGVGFVEDFEAVGARREEFTRFFEGDAVLFLVREVLVMVPGDLTEAV